jgi:hypothetical protein
MERFANIGNLIFQANQLGLIRLQEGDERNV